ncbi:PREDICTED: kelch repeat-containing protein At3g27220-like isoform X2 [Lupinus angustifolius]|uniref:kelch repeat-containing protein At3g27220-like isoform X2 n=1 Tax=Lupinus angustifolius TaxID=3871 RepID=UPI00092F6FA6|nr:PREDICTED: kelch repeat-containing protein At3g27220-like isoform X2 [Lupinus angustifolius]
MVRFHQTHFSATKLVIFSFFSSILCVLLIANIFWASFSSLHHSISSNWVHYNSPIMLIPNLTHYSGEGAKNAKSVPQRFLSATFADLPAPDLHWEKMPSAPVPRLDGYAIQINNLFYVFAGYGSLDYVHSHVDIYNFSSNTWVERVDMPKDMAHSHLGIATDGRYIYVVSGQYGPQCRGPIARVFVLDTETKNWNSLPPLPSPRYAPATQLWRGRLHVMGGSKENRHTPGLDHWSLAVKDGEALEKQWRTEIPIPRGGPHRACIVVNDQLLVIGGQEGDFMAKPGSPIFKCSRRLEVVYDDVYMLDDEMKWKVLPPMPKPNSHIECAWVIVNNSIIIIGGTTEKHPITKRMMLVGEVFQFNLDSMVLLFSSEIVLCISFYLLIHFM